MRFDKIWLDARLATLAPERPGLGVIEPGAVAAKDGQHRLCRRRRLTCHTSGTRLSGSTSTGRWITPGLIDCHTHLVYAGDRAHEFELRLTGASYEEIARAGGGIVSTVTATRAASEDDLVAQSLPRLDALIGRGRHHDRDQVGLWARSRDRSHACCAPRAGSAASAGSRS